ncbi:hypothetical protein Q4Q39_13440 [Flavivirga amylovorans]|uniref:Uncharacterized protein n=1 Tax=Flavivirga amylovorans TaxID=870486 RepID=A0ABT8X368_9FLAO|nr:hypothetical protein [Flavivirga amylovorans]MDO5988410.1 hypothetical protein [Flavivirga amylovorans]
MKTILYVFVFLLIGANFMSCTPQNTTDADVQGINIQDLPDCCGDGGNIPPPTS